MDNQKTFAQRVHDANVNLFRDQARYFDETHFEIFNKLEQKRIISLLKTVDRLISNNRKSALDFGAGTGNITGKLLAMGYKVTAIDISTEMCEILRTKYTGSIKDRRLTVVTGMIEDTTLKQNEFDLITCYAVLHHLPDYPSTIRRLSVFLRRGGIMLLDHEASSYSLNQRTRRAALLRTADWLLARELNNRLMRWRGIRYQRPECSFIANYWVSEGRHIEDRKISDVFREQGFSWVKRQDYPSYPYSLFNPVIFQIRKHLLGSDMSLWIAKK